MARSVLQDVSSCISWLHEETDPFRFRMAVVASIALVRAVGHVLRKVDSSNCPVFAEVVKERFESWKRDRESARIFWEFIESERNNILKEYEFRFDFSPVITTGEATHAWRVGADLYCPVVDGVYVGQDVRDVLQEAVRWWTQELDAIEADYQSRTSQSVSPENAE